MVNTQKGNSQLPIAVKAGFYETFLFSEITFWKKENTHIPRQLLDIISFYWDYIPEQRKSS
jgi:hypothetical protein